MAVLAVGAVIGGYGGAQLLRRVDERLIRGFVVVLGLCLTVGLFLRGSKLSAGRTAPDCAAGRLTPRWTPSRCLSIGAGVVGLAVAQSARTARAVRWWWPKRRASSDRRPARATASVIHAGLYYPPGSLKARALRGGTRAALRLLPAPRGVEHRRCGKLIVATSPKTSSLGLDAIVQTACARPAWTDLRAARRRPQAHVAGAWTWPCLAPPCCRPPPASWMSHGYMLVPAG